MSKPVKHHWSWMVPEEEIVAARTSGLGTILWMMAGAALIFVALLFVLPVVPRPPVNEQPPAPSRPATTPRPTTNRPAPSSGGGGSSIAPVVMPEPLPDCAGVQDTKTACVQEDPTVEPTAIPPTPPYLSSCVTPPSERPCWLPADQAWEAPQSVPETPVVLLPPTDSPPLVFSDSACAAWHPPLPWPKECE